MNIEEANITAADDETTATVDESTASATAADEVAANEPDEALSEAPTEVDDLTMADHLKQGHDRIVAEAARVLAMIERRSAPFDRPWRDWRPDPAWDPPVLPSPWSDRVPEGWIPDV